MIQKTFRHIVAILIASYFLFLGIGYNLVQYCCDCCEKAGIESIVLCSETTHHEDADMHNGCDSDHNPCSFKRISLDTFSAEYEYHLSAPRYIQIALLYTPAFVSIPAIPSTDAKPANPPPRFRCFNNGREILSHKSVLLI